MFDSANAPGLWLVIAAGAARIVAAAVLKPRGIAAVFREVRHSVGNMQSDSVVDGPSSVTD
jgi:hypothetical protein